MLFVAVSADKSATMAWLSAGSASVSASASAVSVFAAAVSVSTERACTRFRSRMFKAGRKSFGNRQCRVRIIGLIFDWVFGGRVDKGLLLLVVLPCPLFDVCGCGSDCWADWIDSSVIRLSMNVLLDGRVIFIPLTTVPVSGVECSVGWVR